MPLPQMPKKRSQAGPGGILHPVGIMLRPEWAALIMAISSIIVVTNALLLNRLQSRLQPET